MFFTLIYQRIWTVTSHKFKIAISSVLKVIQIRNLKRHLVRMVIMHAGCTSTIVHEEEGRGRDEGWGVGELRGGGRWK